MRLEVLFVFVLGSQNVSCYCIKPAGQWCICLASIVHLFWLFYSKINESLYTIEHIAAILYTTRLSLSWEKKAVMRYLKDYLLNMKLNITFMLVVLSEGVTAIPAAEYPCRSRCVLYVGQEESRVLANTNNIPHHGFLWRFSVDQWNDPCHVAGTFALLLRTGLLFHRVHSLPSSLVSLLLY